MKTYQNLSGMIYGMIIGRLDGDGSEPLLDIDFT